MGPVGGKTPTEPKVYLFSLTLSIVSKTKLMNNKIMSITFKTIVGSDHST